jgi:hypothetical protein
VENPWKFDFTASKSLIFIMVYFPSHGRGRRFNPYSAHIQFPRGGFLRCSGVSHATADRALSNGYLSDVRNHASAVLFAAGRRVARQVLGGEFIQIILPINRMVAAEID